MQLSYVLSPLAALALFASTGLSQAQARPRSVSLVFTGAAEGRYELQAPTDGSSFSIDNPLSVSNIALFGVGTCTFFGLDGSRTVVSSGNNRADVGPPQRLLSGTCSA